MAILTVNALTKSFGGLTAVSNASLHVNEGELIGLIGPNGAGKTTLFNLLTGVYTPDSGTVTLHRNGHDIALQGRRPYAICAEGVARTFQNIRLFRDLTVLDNVRIAMHRHARYGFASAFLHLPPYGRMERELLTGTLEILDIFNLVDKKDELARNLPYGEQRKLEIARALATDPALLLLDEPAAGMNPSETEQLTELITWIRSHFKLSILLIEHDMSLVMRICERIYVLDYGTVIANGVPQEIRSNRRVIEAYLGEEEQDA